MLIRTHSEMHAESKQARTIKNINVHVTLIGMVLTAVCKLNMESSIGAV